MPPTLIIGEVELEREQTRGKLAFALLFLLAVTTVFAFVLVVEHPNITSDNVTTFITGIFTPLVALPDGPGPGERVLQPGAPALPEDVTFCSRVCPSVLLRTEWPDQPYRENLTTPLPRKSQ